MSSSCLEASLNADYRPLKLRLVAARTSTATQADSGRSWTYTGLTLLRSDTSTRPNRDTPPRPPPSSPILSPLHRRWPHLFTSGPPKIPPHPITLRHPSHITLPDACASYPVPDGSSVDPVLPASVQLDRQSVEGSHGFSRGSERSRSHGRKRRRRSVCRTVSRSELKLERLEVWGGGRGELVSSRAWALGRWDADGRAFDRGGAIR